MRARPARLVVPERPVAIDRLISPLRYDVVVRQRYFEHLAANVDRTDHDFDGMLADARRHPYHLWFTRVAIARFFPGASAAETDAMFRERIRRSIDLYRSVAEHGFDPRRPIVVHSGGPRVRTSTGKTLSGRVFAGDGCHRLALLRSMGWRSLPPEWCRVRTLHRWSPPDNTATLIREMAISIEDYFAFISAGYADKVFTSERELVEHVAAVSPDRLPELSRVLAVDREAFAAVR